ncbi:putative reverse transcriptase domain-containing protein [Tanacetum coccineum]
MTKLTQKKVKFDWGDKQEAAFQLLKQKLCSAPILALPEEAENFIVYRDASHKVLGKVDIANDSKQPTVMHLWSKIGQVLGPLRIFFEQRIAAMMGYRGGCGG